MHSVSPSTDDGFQGYIVETTDPGIALYVFVLAYMGLSFIMVAPLVIWGNNYERKRLKTIAEKCVDAGSPVVQHQKAVGDVDDEAIVKDHNRPPNPDMEDKVVIITLPAQNAENQQPPGGAEPVFRNFDHTTNAPVDEPEPIRQTGGGSRNKPSTTQTELSMAARSSAVHSAATTSKIYTMQQNSAKYSGQPPKQRVQGGVWDVGGRRWKDRRPFGRADVIRRAIESESRSQNASESASVTSHGITRRSSAGAQQWQNMSDLASSVLDEQGYDGEVTAVGRGMLKGRRMSSRRSAKSTTSTRTSEKSVMPPLNPDAISPNDAADAHDPGRISSLEVVADETVQATVFCGPAALWRARTLSAGWDGLLELAAPNYETRRIVSLALPLTLGAITEPLCRVVMTAFIARTLGTDSMVAFVLVFLLLRLTTEELAGAVVDAESTLILNALCSGQESSVYLAGQYVQLALLLQLLMTIPVFVIWVFYMGDVVNWLVSSSSIADLAKHYTRVIIYRFLAQIVSRTFAVVLHESGNENFDSTVGVVENITTMVTIACVVSFVDDVSLDTVGWIQVLIGCGAAVTKIAWSLYQGWLQPYLKGIFTNVALTNGFALQSTVFTALPLLVGTFLEFGEFEMLTISTRYLGSAEVATFALLTLIWEVFQASNEGIGEAASVRVAFHLGEGHPATARISSSKVLFLSTIFSLLATSLMFLVGKHLAVALTNDFTLQHMLNDAFTFLGFANISLTFSRVCWSLIGAQGRFRTATMVMLLSRWAVALPVAFVCIFGLFLDLNAVVAAVTVGYATACCALAYILFRSKWQHLAQMIQDLNATLSGFDDYDESYDDSENSADRPASGNL